MSVAFVSVVKWINRAWKSLQVTRSRTTESLGYRDSVEGIFKWCSHYTSLSCAVLCLLSCASVRPCSAYRRIIITRYYKQPSTCRNNPGSIGGGPWVRTMHPVNLRHRITHFNYLQRTAQKWIYLLPILVIKPKIILNIIVESKCVSNFCFSSEMFKSRMGGV